jgi:transcriptional regulator with XRE-family HTH domain
MIARQVHEAFQGYRIKPMLNEESKVPSPVDGALTGDDINRVRLAEFVRSRRERLQPEDLGLPVLKRQRTPGLRRDDVAELAGISLAYYTWIEQARDLRLSRTVLDDLAKALRLNEAERQYILTLAGFEAAEGVSVEEEQKLHPTVAHILGEHSTTCAILCDAWFNVVAASPLGREVLFVTTESWPEQNLIWQLCHNRDHASIWKDWQSELRLIVGMFRQSLAKRPHSVAGNRVLEKLSEHPFFASLWTKYDVQLKPSPEEYFREEPWELRNHAVGQLRVHRLGVCLPTQNQRMLTIFSPSDAETMRKFAHLTLRSTNRTDSPRAAP